MLCAILLIAAAEEISFRGYALWRLSRLIGFWRAQAIIAILFALSHATLGGYSLVPALLGTVIGSVLYGVAFARTLLSGRTVLCLDEPFAALDSLTRQEMQDWLAGALLAQPRTVVLVTHDVE